MKKIQRLTLCALFALCSLYASALDFTRTNDDGIYIYYNIVSSSKRTCEVATAFDTPNPYSGSVKIPETVEHKNPYTSTYTVVGIGSSAFSFCSGLTDVTIPNSVTYIGSYAFSYSEDLTSVTLGDSVETIGDDAFYDCCGLTEIALPETLTSIGEWAFGWCTSITSIVIPDNVTSLGDFAFYNCASAKSIVVGSGVTIIPDYGFDYCMSLTDLTLKGDVTYIGNYAFSSSEVLESITCYNPEPPVCGLQVFLNVPKETCIVYVPAGSKEAYSEATGWEDFLNIVEVEFNTELYDALCDEIHIVQDFLSDAWYTIQTDYPYAVDDSRAGYDALNEELANLLALLQDAYMNITLTDELAEEMYTQLEEIKQKIEDLLAEAKNAHELASIDNININSSEVEGIYTISGQKLTAPQKGINIIRYSDGTTKKVLVE